MASSSSSSNLKRYYHVFLSFRGTDVRDGVLSHLYNGLDQRGIHTFMDNEELRKGESITPALMKAIEESRIAIIVFSKDYASSPWCLEELARIMECKDQRDLKVFPVFYKVAPREVRTPRASYKKAMAKHKKKFGKDSEKVKRWEKALLDAGSLSGWEYHKGDEAKLLQSIVEELSIHLDRPLLDVAKYPVGIDSRVQKLISLSQKESGNDDVVMIGLWGTGGVGKTTLAKAMYNAIERQFQGVCFLAQVRENANESNGLVALQVQLLSQILSHRNLTVYNVDGGITLIQERLCCKKVLLVLDDVDKLYQLNALAGNGHWFGKGSRIIVTSRDKHLLKSHGISCVHKIETLDYNEALDLFSRHAFPNSEKVKVRRELIDRAVHCAKGLPLALQVFGSFLCGREELFWESALCGLSKSPNPHINQVLKTSFDGLQHNEREIFLDIACFFKRKRIEHIKQILDSCGFQSTMGIEVLIERALIKNEYGTLQMHDLVQLMGKDIVNQKCRHDPGQRSRLWAFEDIMYILCADAGTNEVEAMVLDSPEAEDIAICPHAFTKMKRLRILILSEVHISSDGPVPLPSELRWLKWPNAPDLEWGCGPKSLVRIDVQESRIKQFGGKFMNFRMLKFINFSGCESLTSVLDLSLAPNLESLCLDYCKSLVEVQNLKTKSLRTLGLFGCSKLEKFPDILEKMGHIGDLDLRETAIKELPMSIENLVSVVMIKLHYCVNLTRLPSSIYKLQNLQFLYLVGCSNFVMFPKNLEDSTNPDSHLGFPNLKLLSLGGCNLSQVDFLESSSSFPKLKTLCLSENQFSHLPASINKYHALEQLVMEECQQLQEIPQLPSNMRNLIANGCKNLARLPSNIYNLEVLRLHGCSNLVMFPKNLEDSTDPDGHLRFPNLVWLDLSDCNLLEVEFLESSSSFPKLKKLCLSENLFTHLPASINEYYALVELDVRECQQRQEIPQLPPRMLYLRQLPDLSRLLSHSLDVNLPSRLLYSCLQVEGLSERSALEIRLPGGEMPEWFLPCEDGSTSFLVPRDLYDKFLGLAFHVVLCPEEGKEVDASCKMEVFVDWKRVIFDRHSFFSPESDCVRISYSPRCHLGHLRDKMLDGWSHFQVCFKQSTSTIVWKMKRWEKALLDAGSLSGWEYHEGDEAKFIQRIAKELSIHLNRTPLFVAKYPVGIDSRVQELISLSQKESGDNDVLMIGLWGPGGVGKTALAKALYNAIYWQFQASSFLEQVGEISNQNNGLVALQEQLLLDLLFPHRRLTVYNVDGGISLIRERLCFKKVLLILDGVDQLDQLDALAGEGHWFGKGSRIIVTSRDRHLLISHGITCVYEVKTFDYNEARDLFCRHALLKRMKIEIRRDLIDRAVHYAKGLPLDLAMFGSFLCGRGEPEWESMLRKFSQGKFQWMQRKADQL